MIEYDQDVWRQSIIIQISLQNFYMINTHIDFRTLS